MAFAPAEHTGAPEDGDTFEAVVMPHHGDLLRRALRLERSSVAAGDLIQDTLERALREYRKLRPESNVGGWLSTIMYHVFCDGRRRRNAWAHASAHAARERPCGSDEAEPVRRWEFISSADVWRAVERLKQRHREVVELRWSQSCSYQTISQQLGIPLATVGTRLLRAHRKLRVLLGQQSASNLMDPGGPGGSP